MENNVLDVRGLSVDIGARRAVSSVSFSVGRGECCALVGESGSGKTLTAMAVSGLLPDGMMATGEIIFRPSGGGEVSLAALSEEKLRVLRGAEISTVFQDPGASLTPTMRIGRMLEETLLAHGKLTRAEARKKAADALKAVEIPSPEEALRRYPHAFSGGQRQRIAIAGAVICSPSLVIADEPTTALDVLAQEKVMELFGKIVRGGAAVLMITHNLALCGELCSHVYVMYAGQIVERGTTAEVFSTPAHPYTAALLDCVPVPQMRIKLREIPGTFTEADKTGCPFFSRCPVSKAECQSALIPEHTVSPTHFARCIHA